MTSFITTMFVLRYLFSTSPTITTTTTTITMPLPPCPSRPAPAKPSLVLSQSNSFLPTTSRSASPLLAMSPRKPDEIPDTEKPLPLLPPPACNVEEMYTSPIKRALKSAWQTTSDLSNSLLSPFSPTAAAAAAEARCSPSKRKRGEYARLGDEKTPDSCEDNDTDLAAAAAAFDNFNLAAFASTGGMNPYATDGVVDEPFADCDARDSNARSRAPFKPNKTGRGTSSWQLKQFAEATLGSGSLRKAVKLPEGEDENEWLAVNGKLDLSRSSHYRRSLAKCS
jgi:hypothetical protein